MSKHWVVERLALAAGLLWVCGGCGLGGFEARLNARVEQLKQESPFDEALHDAIELPGTRVLIRVPKDFTHAWGAGSPVDGGTIDPARVKPQLADRFLELPDLKVTYEGLKKSEQRRLAYYCYVGAKELPKTGARDPGDSIFAQLQTDDYRDAISRWEDVQCPTPEGGSIKWRYLRTSGPMPFYCVDAEGKDENPRFQKLPGTLEVLLRVDKDSGYVTVLAWRAPQEIAEKVGLSPSKDKAGKAGPSRLAKLAGGCVLIAEEGARPRKGKSLPPEPPQPAEGAGEKPAPTEKEQPPPKIVDPTDPKQQRELSLVRLKQIGEAMQRYVQQEKSFPPAASYKGGPPLLSWRVALLNYMGPEEKKLYGQFKIDEPWDSPNNRKLAAYMPEVYKTPGGPDAPQTCYLVPIGPDTIMSPVQGLTPERVRHGLANTLLVVEADAERAKDWTRPDDFDFNPSQPAAGLGKLRAGKFLGVAADAIVHEVNAAADAKSLAALFSASGSEAVDWGLLEKSAAEPPKEKAEPEADFLAEAKAALAEGREQEGLRYLRADAIVRASDEVLGTVRWSPTLKCPVLAVRWGIVVESTSAKSGGDAKQPAGEPKARPEGAKGDAVVEFWREAAVPTVVKRLEDRVSAGHFGECFKGLETGAGGKDKAKARWPGVVLLHEIESTAARKQALEEGLDILFVVQVTPKTTRANPTLSVMTPYLRDVATNKPLWGSNKTLNSRAVEAARKKGSDPLADSLEEVLAFVDDKVRLVEVPNIGRESVVRHAEASVKEFAEAKDKPGGVEKPRDPLPLLMELRYYQWKKLLTAEEVSGHYAKIVGADDGPPLATGTAIERRNVIQRWLPVK